MGDIKLSIPELRKGITSHFDLAKAGKFLQPDLTAREINSQLEDLEVGQRLDWQVVPRRPIRTRISYEHSAKKKTAGDVGIFAKICFKYCGTVQSSQAGKARRPKADLLELDRESEISVAFIYASEEKEKACRSWTFDIATRAHGTGPLLHIDLPRGESREAPRIPRLPSFFLTPVDAIEFVLAELFPLEWKEHRENNGQKFGTAISAHSKRMVRITQEYVTILGHNGGWPGLKSAKRDLLSEPIK